MKQFVQFILAIVSKGLLYFTGGPAERSIIRSIIGTITPNAYWSTHTVIDQSPRPLVRPLVRLMHQAYWPTHTVLNQSTGRWLGPSAEWNRPLLAGRTASVMAAYRPHPKFGDIDPVVSVEIIRIETDIDSFFYPPCIPMPFLGKALKTWFKEKYFTRCFLSLVGIHSQNVLGGCFLTS